MTSSRTRAFCFTKNNYTPEDEAQIKSINADYIVYGHEVAPTTGTRHLQGYIYFSNKLTFPRVKRLLPKGSHIEVARGTPAENTTYCSKGTDIYTAGTEPAQGERTDLEKLRDQVLATGEVPVKDIKNYQQLRFAEGLLRYVQPYHGPREVFWYYGPTGSGKTRSAFEYFDNANISVSRVNFDNHGYAAGYVNTDGAIIDDIRADTVPFHVLLDLTDRYRTQLRQLGLYVPWNPRTIIITAPEPPEVIYSGLSVRQGSMEQLLRRLTVIRFPTTPTA